jgi:hypothetical protein
MIVTIREIDSRAVGLPGHETPALRFEEIVNPSDDTLVGVWELAYHYACFKPVVTLKTDISIFTRMLNPELV